MSCEPKETFISTGASEFRNDKVPVRGVCGVGYTWVDPKFSGLVPPSAQQLC